jgi:hypothetical protein
MLLAAFVSSKSQPVEEASELPHASIAKCRLMQVTEHLWSVSSRPIQFSGCRDRPSSGDSLQSLHCRKNTTCPCQLWGCVILLCEMWQKWPWRLTYMNWPCHLNAAFWKRNEWKRGGNSLRFWNRKCIKWVKNTVFFPNLLLLRWEISLRRDVKGQHVMLIKWENSGAFLSWLLRLEIFLTGDILNEFYRILTTPKYAQ